NQRKATLAAVTKADFLTHPNMNFSIDILTTAKSRLSFLDFLGFSSVLQVRSLRNSRISRWKGLERR
ncbi:MAG: hypothetical protein P8R45_02755, partial [Candidatus Binatia bacterium]|nr:hypothetical protein [Candidatus Binatia bacterium]